jgi:RNA polymerase primary sigma factor
LASLHVEKRRVRRDPERELALVLAAQRGRPGARAELVEAFMGPLTRFAGQHRRIPAPDLEELTQAGVVGLLRAVERYDPELGTPFWAYASWWVRQAMQQLVSELSGPSLGEIETSCRRVAADYLCCRCQRSAPACS